MARPTDIEFNDPPAHDAIWRASRVAASVDHFDDAYGVYAFMTYYQGIESWSGIGCPMVVEYCESIATCGTEVVQA